MVRRYLAPIVLMHIGTFCHTKQRVMSLIIIGRGKERLIGGDNRNVEIIGEHSQLRFDALIITAFMALQFNIEPVVKQRF